MHSFDLIAHVEAVLVSSGLKYEVKRQMIEDMLFSRRHLLIMTRDVLTMETKKIAYIIDKLKDSASVSDLMYVRLLKWRLPIWKAIRTIIIEEIQMIRELAREQRQRLAPKSAENTHIIEISSRHKTLHSS